MEKIINKLIDLSVKGCDVYHHKGSTWLIFTDTKQWVIELTEERTLWYNYNIFNSLFSYASMEVVENENYITKWVENNIINGIQDINYMKFYPNALIKNVVEKGIQEPLRVQDLTEGEVEEVIEFGVKETFDYMDQNVAEWQVDSIIKDGVKKTLTSEFRSRLTAENIIENGVKEVKSMEHDRTTYHGYFNEKNWTHTPLSRVQDVIESGVKETTPSGYLGSIEMNGKIVHQIESPKQNNEVDDVIENGVKHTESNPFDFKDVIEDVVQNGVNKTHGVSKNLFWEIGDTIQNGVKKTISRENPSTMVDDIIKKTKADASQNPMGKVTEVLRDGKVSQ
jgi:hypothetical protein